MSTPPVIAFAELSRLDTVPAGPGVYVWYVRPLIGKPDWQQNLDPIGRDTGDNSFRSVLFEFSESMAPLDVNAEIRTAFRDGWKGRLRSTTYSHASQRLLEHEQEKSFNDYPGPQMDCVMASEKLRRSLTERLEASAVNFWSPVYVGRSKNLRKRLSEHVAEFRRLHDLTNGKKERRDKIKAAVRDDPHQTRLASRLIYAGLKPEQCRVGYLCTADENLTEEEADHLATVLEWLINTWNRPLLGKN